MHSHVDPSTLEFLYRIRPARPGMLTDGPTESESALIDRHFAYLKGLTETGTVILAGRTLTVDAASHGIIVFRARSEEEARRIMMDDPAVEHGVMLAELFPFRVALRAKE